MPSGRTHDRITLWSLPLIAGFTFEHTQDGTLALLVSGGYLLGGLVLGPDLDIHSCQYRRWGPLRWIWLPYRRCMRHRSWLSHGPVIGTVIRIAYLLGWLAAVSLSLILISTIAYQLTGQIEDWQPLAQALVRDNLTSLERSLHQHGKEGLALFIGLELGSMVHALSDGCESYYKKHLRPRKPARSSSSSPPASLPAPSPPPTCRKPQLPSFKRPMND
jgi:uncharacterized metal-binding protein